MEHSLEPGARLGPFEVLVSLGAGGMGEVYRARDTRLGREVALKTLPPSLAGQPARLARLRNEARILGALNHPHIATLFGLEETEGSPVLVMELVEGRTLADRLRAEPLRVREALDLARQIATGLEAAHDKSIIHRDLKPANIAIDRRGQAKLLDFGLADAPDVDEADSHLSTASDVPGRAGVAGTVPYMSPEQARGERLDKRTDVWSFGCVLYEMLAGKRAFPGAGWAETTAAILEREPDWTALPDATPAGVRRLLERCLQKDPERRLRDVGDARLELEDAIAPGRRPLARRDEETPYPGLAPFAEVDADDFFGREAEVEALWAKLRTKTLLAVIGPSGAGKTSFVRAGIVASRPEDWAAIVSTPGSAPMQRLGQALAPELAGHRDALQYLVRFEEPEAAFEALVRWRKGHASALLVVDQFEELFTLNPPDVQARFAGLLGRLAVEADVHVLLSLRDDFLMRCERHEPLAGVFDNLTPLGPPSAAGLRRALVEPAIRRGYRFEDEALVSDMLTAVAGERGALPLLGFAAARLWERRDPGMRLLTRVAYEEIGGVSGALARHAEATLDRIDVARREHVREIFRDLVTAQGTRAAADRDELISVFADRAEGEQVLDALIHARLLTAYEVTTAEATSRRQQVEIVHESLLAEWPRLVRWQAQDAEGALLRDQLRQAAHLWEERGRLDDLVWTGTAFREYQVWRERYPGALTELEEAFAASMTRRALRSRRRRRTAVVALIGLLTVGLTVMGALWRRSEQQVRRAEAAKLLALGRLQLDDYPTAAVAFATKSLELADTQEARRFAIEALWRGPTAFILPLPGGTFWRLDFSPDGKWIATSPLEANVLVWPSSGARPIVLGHEPTGSQRKVEFGPASDLLVTGSQRNDPLRLWSIPKGELLRQIDLDEQKSFLVRGDRLVTFTQSPGGDVSRLRSWSLAGRLAQDLGRLDMTGVAAATMDPDRRWLVLARGRRVMLRPLAALDSGPETVVGAHADKVTHIVSGAGPEGPVVSRDAMGEIRLWSLSSNVVRLLRVLRGPDSGGWECLDDTGTWLAKSDQRSVVLWDLAAPSGTDAMALRRSDATRFEQLDFATTEGQWLAAANDLSLSFWPLARRYARVLRGHTGQIRSLVYAPNGSWIATTSHDETVRIWPLDGGSANGPRVVARNPGGWGYGLAVDPAGRRLLATFAGPTALITDFITGSPLARLDRVVGGPHAAAFDRDGHRAAVGASYATEPKNMVIRIWNAGSRQVLKDLPLPGADTSSTSRDPGKGGVVSLEFAPDAQLYSAGSGGVRSGTSSEARARRSSRAHTCSWTSVETVARYWPRRGRVRPLRAFLQPRCSMTSKVAPLEASRRTARW